MRMFTKLLAASASALALAALLAGPAMADPPGTTIPKVGDVVLVGSDTTQFLMDQMSRTFNKGLAASATHLYSWDAVPQGQMIKPKATCSKIVRPTGSSAGITALESSQKISTGTKFCLDAARSSRDRASTDPPCAANGICFVKLGGDQLTYATRKAGTNAPASLTPAQLKSIYLCKVRNWNQVGGKTGTIKPFEPQSGSGTLASWLTFLGNGTPITPGACVSDVNNTLIENQGDAPQLNNANAIWPYSVADFISQAYHSAHCATANCGYPAAPTCKPSGSENLFGCDLTGVSKLNLISNKKPALPWPLPAPPKPPAINTKVHQNAAFLAQFQRTVNTVVRFANTANHIPAYLNKFFGATGFACTGTGATIVKNYGFLALPTCGSAS